MKRVISYKIEALIYFSVPDNDFHNTIMEMLDDLSTCSNKISIPLNNFGYVKPIIKRVTKDDTLTITCGNKSIDFPGIREELTITSIINSDGEIEKRFCEMALDKGIKDQVELVESYICGLFQSRVTSILVFSQLAYPGTINSCSGGIRINGKPKDYYFDDLSSILSGITILENSVKWPRLKKLPIIDTWNYILNYTNIFTESPKTNIERALSAFSYLFQDPVNYPVSLIWSMSGIEALYADGDVGISFQIDRKSKEFLGYPEEHKKILTRLYDYRSKYLHGSLSIPLNFSWSGGNQDEHDEKQIEMASLAARLLVATLQEIIIRSISNFEFVFKLKDDN